jgi:hypothetical protein
VTWTAAKSASFIRPPNEVSSCRLAGPWAWAKPASSCESSSPKQLECHPAQTAEHQPWQKRFQNRQPYPNSSHPDRDFQPGFPRVAPRSLLRNSCRPWPVRCAHQRGRGTMHCHPFILPCPNMNHFPMCHAPTLPRPARWRYNRDVRGPDGHIRVFDNHSSPAFRPNGPSFLSPAHRASGLGNPPPRQVQDSHEIKGAAEMKTMSPLPFGIHHVRDAGATVGGEEPGD